MAAPWRGRGDGRAPLRAVAGRARSAGIARIGPSAGRRNFARRLYEPEGYRVTGPGYAGAGTMVKDLAAG